MTESAKSKPRVLVICTLHEYQRHQDTMPDREKVRAEFEKRLRQLIEERKISLVAEEAGDDKAVWENLKRNDELVGGEFAEAFGGSGSKTVDSPVPTIAKKIADEHHGVVRPVDIRPPNGGQMTLEQYDKAMAEKILKELGTAAEVLVIIGIDHCKGMTELLKKQDLTVEGFCFPACSPDQ